MEPVACAVRKSAGLNIESGRGFQLWRRSKLPRLKLVAGFKNGSDIANGGDITLADGRKLYVGSSGTGAPYEEKTP